MQIEIPKGADAVSLAKAMHELYEVYISVYRQWEKSEDDREAYKSEMLRYRTALDALQRDFNLKLKSEVATFKAKHLLYLKKKKRKLSKKGPLAKAEN